MTDSKTDYRLVEASDIPTAFKLETAGFPADEAASLESLQSRQRVARDFFLGVYISNELVGFTCSTLTSSSTLTHDSMSNHDSNGSYVAIHSVCVSSAHRRKGLALSLLQNYLARLGQIERIAGARLITHQYLIPLYEKAGFELVGESSVVHGSEKWYEMKVDFPRSRSNRAEKALNEKEEIEEEEGEVRNPGRKLASFKSGITAELLDATTRTNKADLFCPRAECRCLLLKRGAARFVRARVDDFELPALPRPVSSPSPTLPQSVGYWSVDSPLSFENVGFSRNALPPTTSSSSSNPSATIKYLICADCDHGPLGWHDTEGRDLGIEVAEENEGAVGNVRKGREFLLSAERVRYRV